MKNSLNDRLNEIVPKIAYYIGIIGFIALNIYEFITKPFI